MAYVFYNRVERIARACLNTGRRRGNYDLDNVIVLGHAMAHEIGRLLLPYGHSAAGLMRADWAAQDMHLAVHGRLNFTSEQAELIRTRLLARLAERQCRLPTPVFGPWTWPRSSEDSRHGPGGQTIPGCRRAADSSSQSG